MIPALVLLAAHGRGAHAASGGEDLVEAIRRTVPARAERSGAFVLITDVGADPAAASLADLAQADEALDALLARPAPAAQRPVIWITALADVGGAECLHRFGELRERGSAAFYSRSCGAIHLSAAVDPESREVARRSLLHEAAHQRLAAEGLPLIEGPGAWIGEGIATFLESLSCEGTYDVEGLDRIAVARSLHDGELLVPLPTFLDLDRASAEGLGDVEAEYDWKRIVFRRAVPVYHTQAFATFAFLRELLGPAFRSFLGDALSGGASAELVRSHTCLSAEELEARFAAWLDRTSPPAWTASGGATTDPCPTQVPPQPAAAPASGAAEPALRPGSEDELVRLENHFIPGRARRYRVTSTMSTRVGRQESPNEILNEMLTDRPVPAVEVSEITFEEEELCSEVSAELVADVSYRCLAFAAKELVGDETVLDLRIRDASEVLKVADVPKFTNMVALMEAPIRFKIDPHHKVLEVTLPRELPGAAGEQFRESYRQSLETRYQAFFPDGPVRPGDRWVREVSTGQTFWSAGFAIPDTSLVSTTRFAGIEQHRGRRCARLDVDIVLGIEPGTALHKNTISRLVADEMKGRSTILFDIDAGTPMLEQTTVSFFMRRVNGTAKTEKIETPIEVTQVIEAAWVGPNGGEAQER